MAGSGQPLIWKNGLRRGRTKPRATVVPPEVWESHRVKIHQKYMDDGMSLQQVVQYMKVNHNFCATARQYSTQFEKWGPAFQKRPSLPRRDSMFVPPAFHHIDAHASFTALPQIDEFSPRPTALTQGASPTLSAPGLLCESASASALGLDPESPPKTSSKQSPSSSLDSSSSGSEDDGSDETLFHMDFPIPPSSSRVVDTDSHTTRSSSSLSSRSVSTNGRESPFIASLQNSSSLHSPSSDKHNNPCMSPDESSLPAPSRDPYNIPIHLLTITESNSNVNVSSTKESSALILADIFKSPGVPLNISISEDDAQELMRVSDFLFAAQSYADCFKVSRVLMASLINRSQEDRRNEVRHSASHWLRTVTNMIKSTTNNDEYKLVVRIVNDVHSRKDLRLATESRYYSLLFAFLGDLLHRLSSHEKAAKATVLCWMRMRRLPNESRPAVAQRIIKEITPEVIAKSTDPDTRLLAREGLQKPLATSASEDDSACSNALDKCIQIVVYWCILQMAEAECRFMIDNVDEMFWHVSIKAKDVRHFENLLLHCYLCERLWRLEKLRRKHLPNLALGVDVLEALDQLHLWSGLSNEDMLGAVIKASKVVRLGSKDRPQKLSFVERHMAKLDEIHRNNSLYLTSYVLSGPMLTTANLLTHCVWPCSSTTKPLFSRADYAEGVRIFLREFASVSLELDLTKRLQQNRGYNCDRRASITSVVLSPTARSSQISEDYATFKIAGTASSAATKPQAGDGLSAPTDGLDDLMSDTSSNHKLFRYSGSIESLRSGDRMSTSVKSTLSSNRISISGSSSKESRITSLSADNLARSSIIEMDEPEVVKENTRRNARQIF